MHMVYAGNTIVSITPYGDQRPGLMGTGGRYAELYNTNADNIDIINYQLDMRCATVASIEINPAMPTFVPDRLHCMHATASQDVDASSS